MPLPLPDLDKRRFDDLVAEMRVLIPQFAPEWTNHNPSDPGVTLTELLAWVTEVNLYRANRVTPRTVANFLSLLLGESSIPSEAFQAAMHGVSSADIERKARQVSAEIEDVFVRYAEQETRVSVLIVVRAGATQLADIVAATQKQLANLWVVGPKLTVELLESAKQRALRFFNDPYRAITTSDFEREAMLADPAVGRVAIVANALLGSITVAVVPATGVVASPGLLARVKRRLEDRKLVGTRIIVRPAAYTRVDLKVRLGVRPNSLAEKALSDTDVLLRRFFDPLAGGQDGTGWPFGRPVSVYELYRIIESVPGVDHVESVEMNADPDRHEVPIEDLPIMGSLETITVN
ncbi:MAG: baseplate J/gp47 family protein [Candidatus Accumulibacter sp. UW20]|jgi:hypothetical protein